MLCRSFDAFVRRSLRVLQELYGCRFSIRRVVPDADVFKVSFTIATSAPNVAFISAATQRSTVNVDYRDRQTGSPVNVSAATQRSTVNVAFISAATQRSTVNVGDRDRDRDRNRDRDTASTSNLIELSNPNAFYGGKEC